MGVDADLMSKSLLAVDKMAFHLANLDWTLSITKLKAIQAILVWATI